MYEQPGQAPDDVGDDLAAAAVEALRSTAQVRAAADAIELQSIATLAQVRRQQAVAQARQVAREGDRARGRPPGSSRPAPVDLDLIDRLTAQEVSLALWLSPVVARDRLELAVELVERRPATFEALRTGGIDLVRARRINDAVRGLPVRATAASAASAVDADSPADQVEAEALRPGSTNLADLRPGRSAGELTPAQLTARLTRLVLRVDPRGAGDRTERADARRGCTLRPLPDGMAVLSFTGRAELVSAAFTRIDTAARSLVATDRAEALRATRVGQADASVGVAGTGGTGPAPGVDAARTLDQARVDVVLASLLGHSSELAHAAGATLTVALVAPAGTVLAGGDEPGELLGYGPVAAPLVRALAADATWTRWTSDAAAGQVTAVDRRRYRPSAAVADLVRARDLWCRFPTCGRVARACDLDHVVAHPGGDTHPCNLATECRLHHLLKHHAGFLLRLDPDGTATWTTPTGQRVIDQPPSWGRRAPVELDRLPDRLTASTGPPDPRPPF